MLVAILVMALATSWHTRALAHDAPEDQISATINADDFTFDMPSELDAGYVAFTLINNGEEDHHAQLLRLNDGVTSDDFIAALETDSEAAIFELATLAGGPGLTAPGKESTAIVPLEAGNYVALCLVPSHDGVPHAAKGMIQPFTVTGEVTGEEPVADVTATMRDFGFVAPTEVEAGHQQWQVVNEGPQPHELIVRRLDDGVTYDQIVSQSRAVAPATPAPENGEGTSQAPITSMTTAVGGVQAVAPGDSAWLSIDLEPGTYVIICHVPDPATGKEHADLGMIQELTVT
jgi:uncharacterized cupredoxin-like copper-binding protein